MSEENASAAKYNKNFISMIKIKTGDPLIKNNILTDIRKISVMHPKTNEMINHRNLIGADPHRFLKLINFQQ